MTTVFIGFLVITALMALVAFFDEIVAVLMMLAFIGICWVVGWFVQRMLL